MRAIHLKLALLAAVWLVPALGGGVAQAQDDFEVTLEVLDDISDVEGVLLILEEDRDDDAAEPNDDSADRSADESAGVTESDEDIGDTSEDELDDAADLGSDSDSLDREDADEEPVDEDTLSDSDLETDD